MAQPAFQDQDEEAGRISSHLMRDSTEDVTTPTKTQVTITETLWDQVLTTFRNMQKELQEDARTRGMSNCSTTPKLSASGSSLKSSESGTTVKSRLQAEEQPSEGHAHNARNQLSDPASCYPAL
ncbi:uncharacterized protein C12orf54 homolog [Erinaceus europaeus]|uniref:Uncharacterized protein C12orf54 homolog n=1 Tax=Erinaceus europaeus TaxID=9365 RepID=A0ABM3XRK2_ERIEU|nr:uncharacterized protein C12orf54 homolog [Erinaceus europaeus]